MASAATLAAFLLCCFFSIALTDSQDGCDLYAATGTSVAVPLKYTLKNSDTLRWRKDSTIIYNSKDKATKPIDFVVHSNGSLELTKLTKDKSGRYTPEVHSADGVSAGDLQSVRLCVLDRVKKPKVTVKCFDPKKEVIFTCDAGQNEKHEWLMDSKKLTVKEKTLTKVASEVVNARFSCNVSNPVSSEISAPVQQNCYKPSFPEELWGISIWVFVGGGAGIVLVLILIVIICCIQTKRKRRMQLKDEGELRLQWANQERQQQQQQQHHHQHQHQHQNRPDQHHHPHHHQQQPAGNTGPRQHRSKQQRTQQRPRAPDPPNGHPQPSPRRAVQASRPADNDNEEQPPPLPQPRKKKAPKE